MQYPKIGPDWEYEDDDEDTGYDYNDYDDYDDEDSDIEEEYI